MLIAWALLPILSSFYNFISLMYAFSSWPSWKDSLSYFYYSSNPVKDFHPLFFITLEVWDSLSFSTWGSLLIRLNLVSYGSEYFWLSSRIRLNSSAYVFELVWLIFLRKEFYRANGGSLELKLVELILFVPSSGFITA